MVMSFIGPSAHFFLGIDEAIMKGDLLKNKLADSAARAQKMMRRKGNIVNEARKAEQKHQKE